MMSRDRETPRQFRQLNRHGVPMWPLVIAVWSAHREMLLPRTSPRLPGSYAIGVVGAITVNLGSCTFNRAVDFTWYDRVLFGITFVILAFAFFSTNQIFLPTTNQSDTTRFTMAILSTILVGLIVGAIAKLLMPGKDPGGFIITILLGIAGAFVATYLGQALGWYKAGQPAGWIMSVVGAMVLLLLYRFLFKRGA